MPCSVPATAGAEFATDNGVAGASPAVRDDGRRLFHDRLPVRVGLVRDQHLAVLEGLQMLHIRDQTHRAMANFSPILCPRTSTDPRCCT